MRNTKVSIYSNSLADEIQPHAESLLQGNFSKSAANLNKKVHCDMISNTKIAIQAILVQTDCNIV